MIFFAASGLPPAASKATLAVPQLTRGAPIKLNARVLLRWRPRMALILPPELPGPTVAEPSVEHIPAGGFVYRRSGKKNGVAFGVDQPPTEAALISLFGGGL
jgi:hypothetical protein